MLIAQSLPDLSSLGTPSWLLLLIAGGSIVAAVIGGINAVVVAVINAYAARQLALHTAHRERRQEIASANVTFGRELATIARC